MPTVLPPPKKTGRKADPAKRSETALLVDLFKGKGKAYVPYKDAIIAAANRFDLSPVYLLGLLVIENQGANPNAKSSAGAVGLAQILDGSVRKDLNPHYYNDFTRYYGTKMKKTDPTWAIGYAAWRLKGGMIAKGSFDAAYASSYYNPGFKGDSRGSTASAIAGIPSAWVPPKATTVDAGTPTVGQAAATAATAAAARAAAKNTLARKADPYVVVNKNGTISYSTSLNKGVLTGFGSSGPYPVTRSTFEAIKAGNGAQTGLDDIYQQWAGRNATGAEVAKFISKSWSIDTLQRKIAYNDPGFFKTKMFAASFQGYQERMAQIYGPGFKLDPKIVREAMMYQWQPQDFDAKMRALPSYTKSTEFKNSKDAFIQKFQDIYGTPDAEDQRLVSDAVLARWTPEQFESYLKARPEYVNSPAYQADRTQFWRQMQQLTGVAPIAVQPKVSPFKSAETTPPADKRVAAGQAPTGQPHGTPFLQPTEPYQSPLKVTSAKTQPAKPTAPQTKVPRVTRPDDRAGARGPTPPQQGRRTADNRPGRRGP